jgi:hypothetical protein
VDYTTSYNTNLAAEFYVLSMLHRLGLDAFLTLGNKKAVDILVVRPNDQTVKIDVKGLAGRYDWPADNIKPSTDKRHFIVLLSIEGHINEPQQVPSVWVVPATWLGEFVREYPTRKVIWRRKILETADKYRDGWHLIRGRRSHRN